MVEESYSLGAKVLDPCCGSGNFLVGIIKYLLSQDLTKREKFESINRVYGFDINPISIFISKINLLFLLKEEISEIKLNLYTLDFLFQPRSELKDQFDLVIGNPPWYTYRDVDSMDYQEKLKNLAEQLEIKPRPKNVLNLEVSTLFHGILARLKILLSGLIFTNISSISINLTKIKFLGFKSAPL
ncbi:unnamed protein product [marine sediment metagenome]|uniref:site-specific DNA-methyltransferase (adenine-specific) n=1 Tax=marine sediment metagenome TaxID=412755 RepID=X1FQ61_9ZZZZ